MQGVEAGTLEALEKLREEYESVEEGVVEEAGKIEADLTVRIVIINKYIFIFSVFSVFFNFRNFRNVQFKK